MVQFGSHPSDEEIGLRKTSLAIFGSPASERATEMASDVTCCETKFWLYLLVIIGLVCFAGMMAGLTLGLMSLGLVDLEVLMKSGRPQDRLHAGTFYSFSHLKFQSSL